MLRSCRLVLCILACLSVSAGAAVKDTKNQPQKNPQQQPADPKAKPADSEVIKVTIGTSRPTVTTGGSFGITGYLKNVSSSNVVIYAKETKLVVQPEVTEAKECVFAIDAFFPTEPGSNDGRGDRVMIRPNEGYQVAWDVSRRNTGDCSDSPANTGNTKPDCHWSACGALQRFGGWLNWWRTTANFVPGNYVFIVSGKAYDVKEDKASDQNAEAAKPEDKKAGNQDKSSADNNLAKCDCESGYHTFSESTLLNVAVPQLVVVIFSAFGGLLAYLMLIFAGGDEFKELRDMKSPAYPILNLSENTRKVTGFCRRALAAMLTSSLVTVVTSRVSTETLVPIKVSVNDMWGAITFGFIAYFLGGKFIEWLKDFTKKKPPQEGGKGEPAPKPDGPKPETPADKPSEHKATDQGNAQNEPPQKPESAADANVQQGKEKREEPATQGHVP